MSVTASEFNEDSTVWFTALSNWPQRKQQNALLLVLCERLHWSAVFPLTKPINVKTVSVLWSHHDLKILSQHHIGAHTTISGQRSIRTSCHRQISRWTCRLLYVAFYPCVDQCIKFLYWKVILANKCIWNYFTSIDNAYYAQYPKTMVTYDN